MNKYFETDQQEMIDKYYISKEVIDALLCKIKKEHDYSCQCDEIIKYIRKELKLPKKASYCKGCSLKCIASDCDCQCHEKMREEIIKDADKLLKSVKKK